MSVGSTAEMTAADLRRYGEDETAEWILSCSDEELERVFQAAGYAYLQGGPLARACAAAAVYVCEGVPRELRRKRRKPATGPEGPLLRNGRYTSLALRRVVDEIRDYGIGQDLIDHFGSDSLPARRSAWAGDRVTGSAWSRPEFGERDDLSVSWCTWFPEELDARVRRSVSRVGSADFGLPHTFYSIFPLEPGADVGEEPAAVEFLQATGTVDRLLVEIKRREADGVLRQYAVGRAPGPDGAGLEVVRQGEYEHRVPAHEVHTAAAAQDLFSHYLVHRDVPAGIALRELPEFREPV